MQSLTAKDAKDAKDYFSNGNHKSLGFSISFPSRPQRPWR